MSKKHLVSFLLLDENFHGAIEAKLDNWTGLAYRIPRDRIAAYAERKVLSYSGVYLLFGKDEKTGEDAVYIGQAQERLAGGSILNRLSEHNRNPEKAFYSEVVFFTSATNSFGPTELCYLENRFYQMAKDANRFVVKNREVPSPGNVTEAKEVELDRYIENAALLVQGFGYRVFEPKVAGERISETFGLSVPEEPRVRRERRSVFSEAKNQKAPKVGKALPLAKIPKANKKVPKVDPPRFYFTRLIHKKYRVSGEMIWTGDECVVLKGAVVCMENRAGIKPGMVLYRNRLVNLGILVQIEGELYRLTKDQTFATSSAAGSFVLGGAIRGPMEWKTADGRTFAEVSGDI